MIICPLVRLTAFFLSKKCPKGHSKEREVTMKMIIAGILAVLLSWNLMRKLESGSLLEVAINGSALVLIGAFSKFVS